MAVVLTQSALVKSVVEYFVNAVTLTEPNGYRWTQDRDARENDVPTPCFALGPYAGRGVRQLTSLQSPFPLRPQVFPEDEVEWAPGGYRRHSLPPPALLDWLLCAPTLCPALSSAIN